MSQSTLHYEQGKLCYQNKKFHDAIFQFSEAIRLKPDNNIAMARCYNARGVVYFYLGEFKKVIKDCTKALELDSENANYYNCRGNAYFSLGKFGKAAEDFSKAITLSPEASHGRYYNNRGSAYRRLKMFKEAIDDYTAAIQVDPKNGNYYNNRGNTYFDMGEFQLAIDDFTTALGLEPYSPKTKLTLAQAHEALAQEKRMKNATQFQGFYSHMKTVKQGKRVKSYRKDRQASIYVSPAGVEVTFERGWRAKKDQQSFAWSEDMKIELVDDETVKLYMDKSRQTYVVIKSQNPDGPAVEEELIGRITTKFASYSTACLVAQHEGVCNEYADIIKSVKKAEEQLSLLKVLAEEAEKQKAAFIKQEQFDKAEKSKAQAAKLQDAIKQKQLFIETESTRAESVRVKAEQEAGPVLDMVLIMQNRVRELYQTRVKGVKQHYKVDDLELEEQLAKMEQLVVRAQELQALVSRSVQDVRRALDVVDKDEEIEDDDEKSPEPAAEPEPEPTPEPVAATPASAPAPVVVEAIASAPAPEPVAASAPEPAPAPVVVPTEPLSPSASATEPDWNKLAEADSDASDWDDDIDGVELPTQFAPTGQEVFMTVESANGMVTITPSKSTELRDGPLPHQGKIGREILLMDKTSFSKLTTEVEQKAHDLADELEKYKQENAAKQQQLEEKEQLLNQMVTAQHAAHELAAERERLAKELEDAKKAAEDLASAKSQMEAAATSTEQQKVQMEQQHQEALRKAKELNDQVAEYHHLVEQKNAEEARLKSEYENMAKQTAEYEAKVHDMASRLEEEAEKRRIAEEEIKRRETEHVAKAQELQQAVAEKEKEKKDLWEQVREQDMSLSAMRKHLAEMQTQLKAQAEAQAEKDRLLAESKAMLEVEEKRVAALKEQSLKEEQKRRELHNLIQEIKGNIRVYVRIRPGQHADSYNAYESVLGSDERGLRVVGAPEQSATGGAAVQKKWEFEFDRVFFPNNTQNEIFSEISQLVQSALDGYAVSIFAYGQTGSGKTYTMEGPSALTDDTKGMIPRSVAKIFEHSEAYIKKGWSYTTEVSFLEIYNTEIRDLLRTGDMVPLEVKLVATKTGNKTEVPDLTWTKVSSAEDLEPVQKQASAARASAATLMNERSSRSHSVFTLRITGYHKESGQISNGVLNLIDLAGSERVEKSGAVGQRLDEAKAINASLSCLGDVIAALAQGSKHVPFRNSKLTYLLQDSFGGGSKTLMFINIAPELEHMQESLSSLRFGAKVHDCHIGTGKKNIAAASPGPAATATPAKKAAPASATKAKK